MKSRRLTLAVLVILLTYWIFIAWCVPYGPVDDFQWGTEDGLRWWLGGVLNGRYVGNMFSVILCRFPPVKVLFMGLSMFLIPTLAAWLGIRGRQECFLPALLMCHTGILLMPPLMWREVYGWVSGFSIYGSSTLIFLLWLLALRLAEQDRTRPWAWAALLFPLTLALGMTVENLTLLVLGASLVLALYSIWDKPLRIPFLACLLGATLALIPMFFNSVVTELLSTGAALGEQRHLSVLLQDGLVPVLKGVLVRYTEVLLPIAFLRGPHFAVPLALLIACAFWNGPLRPLSVTAVIPLVYRAHMMLLTESFWNTEVGLLEDMVILLCWFLPVLALVLQRESRRRRWRQILAYLAAPLSLFPFAITSVIGQRMFLLPLSLVLLTAADVALPLLRRRSAVCLIAAVLTVFMILWGSRCGEALACTSLRARLIREAAETGSDTLILPTDRQQGKAVYLRNPGSVEFAYHFRDFFHISQDVTLIILPPGSSQVWPDIPPEMWEKRTEMPPCVDFEPALP